MSLVRIALERLLLGLLWLARCAFLAQGLALSIALLPARWAGGQAAEPWLLDLVRTGIWLGGSFLLCGGLLVAARGLPDPRVDDADPAAWPWPWLLGGSLVALPALAAAASSELVPLWREILGILDAIGLPEALGEADPYGGIVLLPIAAALFLPMLEAVAAFFLIAPPLALLVLLATRSRLFPRLFAMTVACQTGLVLASLIAAEEWSRLAPQVIALMTAAPDPEVLREAERLRRAQGVLSSVAAGFTAPLLGYLLWTSALWLLRGVGAFFAVGSSGPAPTGGADPSGSPHARPASLRERAPAAQPTHALAERRARIALVALGSLLLTFGTADALRARARSVRSDPATATAGPALAERVEPVLPERAPGERRRRQNLVGGAFLIALGALLPRLPRRP